MFVFGSLQDYKKGQSQGCFNGKCMRDCLKVLLLVIYSSLTENATCLQLQMQHRDVLSVLVQLCILVIRARVKLTENEL